MWDAVDLTGTLSSSLKGQSRKPYRVGTTKLFYHEN